MPSLSLTSVATAAAQLLGVLDSGEALSTQQLTDAQGIANAILDNWSSDPKKILQLGKISWNLSAGVQSYTIGASQTINVARPMALVSAAFTNTNGIGGGLKVRSADEWEMLTDRQRQSNLLADIFYDRGFPTGNIYLSPVPLGGSLIGEAMVWAALTQFADNTTPITILPGYQRLLQAQLAVDLSGEYVVSDSALAKVMAMRDEALAIVESLNATLFATLPPDAQAQLAKVGAA